MKMMLTLGQRRSDMWLLRIRKKHGDLKKLAVMHGIGQRPGNAGTWMEQSHGDASVHSTGASADTRCKKAVGNDYGGSANGYDVRLQRMRIQGNYCQNVQARKATSGMESMVERPMERPTVTAEITKQTSTLPKGYTTRAGHVARGPGQIGRGHGGCASGTSSETRKLGVRN